MGRIHHRDGGVIYRPATPTTRGQQLGNARNDAMAIAMLLTAIATVQYLSFIRSAHLSF
jgi:hypothetical protein